MTRETDPTRISVPGLAFRRILYASLVLGSTFGGGLGMLAIVSAGGVTGLEVAILLLFVPTFGWITTSFWNAVIGFVLGVTGRDPLTLDRLGTPRDPAPLTTRTALVMPAHNEQPGLVASGLTEAKQPGAPNGARLNGNGPSGDVALSRPSAMIAAFCGRLSRVMATDVPTVGPDVGVSVVTPMVPLQPWAKKP